MAGEHDVSHGDILLAVGQIQGKLDALITTVSQQRSDMAEAFRRIGNAEQRIAQGVLLAGIMSIIMPIIVVMLAPRLIFTSHQPATIQQQRP